MNSKYRSFIIGLSVMIAISLFFAFFGERPESTEPVTTQPDTATRRVRKVEISEREFLNTDPKVAYVGDAACVNCHFAEAESFHAHPMGRSVREVAKVDLPPMNGPILADGYRYSIKKDEISGLVHVEEKLDSEGNVVQRREESISLVVGSGKRGHSFITDKAGFMHQSPISWYGLSKSYELSPGYDSRNLHFDFPISQACLHCHTNRAESKANGALEIKGLTIGCERCHGPGELHIESQKIENGYDKTIVNPAKLSSTRRDQVCYQCHLALNQRTEIPGKSIVDYRPGTDLETFIERSSAILADPFANLSASGYVKSMEDSHCFQKSDGKLGCMTCHNPHGWIESVEERSRVHIKTCNNCHSNDEGCSLPTPTRLLKSPTDDCIACHMPARPTSDIGHTALTDHTIRRVTPAYEAMRQTTTP